MSRFNIKTPTDWANAFLGALKLPDTKSNVANIVEWEAAEGGAGPQFGIAANDDDYNPINTTLPEPGAVSTNSAGVKAYTSWQQGLDATVATIEAGSYGYPAILDALKSNSDFATFAQAVSSSSWGTDLLGDVPGTSGAVETAAYSSSGGLSGGGGTTDAAGVPTKTDTIANNPANKPATSETAIDLTGFAGVLQQVDQWYNPASPGVWKDITTLGTAPVEEIAILIFTRITSSLLFLGITTIGVLTLLRGSSSSGGLGSSGNNILEFVNQQQSRNLSAARLAEAAHTREAVAQRHTERIGVHHAEIKQSAKNRKVRKAQEQGRNVRHAQKNATARGYLTLGHRYAQHEENRQRAKGIFNEGEE